tara:strand:- start:522 stop:746 length:225 start_codon:yes stop_codon:yes gene_type:complete
MSYKKKVNLAKFTPERREKGIKASKQIVYNDDITSHQRKFQKIKEVANGCWWVESYLMGNLTFRDTKPSLSDDE